MTVKYLRQNALDALYQSVPENLDRYRNGDFKYLISDPTFHREVDIVAPKTVKLKASANAQKDARNALRLWKKYSHFTPVDARDSRIWTLLSHTDFLDYSRARYPIPKDDKEAVKSIRLHFFASTARGLERDHAVSRLWWSAFMASRVKNLEVKQALDTFLYKLDVRANLAERSTMAQCHNLFSAWIEVLHENKSTKKEEFFSRNVYRSALKDLNALGGYILLDSLDAATLKATVKNALTNNVQ